MKNLSQKRKAKRSSDMAVYKQDSVEDIQLDLSCVKKERSRINKMRKDTSVCSRGSSCGSSSRVLPLSMQKRQSSKISSKGSRSKTSQSPREPQSFAAHMAEYRNQIKGAAQTEEVAKS